MHIILVDDEQSALNVLEGAVKEAVACAKIDTFRDAQSAIEHMKKVQCEVAFLDIQMREINGITLAKCLKEIYPKVNIIFVTGYAQYTNEAFAIHASGYIYKPVTADKIINEMENLRNPVNWKESGIYIKTFGDFEVLVDNKQVTFAREKSKEMLAYLVDNCGRSVTRKELANVLFEKEDYTRTTQNYLSKIIKELVNALEQVGAEKILKRGMNAYSVDVDAFSCDYYAYNKPDATPEELNRFQGEYMQQYSWAETTLARLYWGNRK